MIIAISGEPGAGKSTLARALAKKLDYKHYSMGDIRKMMAREKGLTLPEFNKLSEKDPSSDIYVDRYAEKLGRTEDNFVIDGTLVYHFIPHAFKVMLKADESERARRVFSDLKNRPSESYSTPEETKTRLRERLESDRRRYRKLYGIERYPEPEKFDLIIDTTNKTVEEEVEEVLRALRKPGRGQKH